MPILNDQFRRKKDDLYERAVLKKLFHSSQIREQYIKNTLPQFFGNVQRKAVFYVMKTLFEKEIDVTLDNIVLYMQKEEEGLRAFYKKNFMLPLQESEVSNILFDPTVNASDDLYPLAYEQLLANAFGRFVDKQIKDIQYENDKRERKREPVILSKARGIERVHKIIHNIAEKKENQLKETQRVINSNDEYTSSCSAALNSRIGGFTRGYVAAVIAKSGHNKSTFIDYNSAHTILSKKAERIVVITPEESAATRWRRILAATCKISTSMMRQKTVKITDEHIARVEHLFKDKLIFIDDAFKYKDVLEAIHYTKADMVVLDHMQSVDYPGSGSYMDRMIGNIPALIDFEKRLAKERRIPFINLSQVNDKDIQRSDRLIKAPRYWDAYGSSVMYQASREFLALWYPVKDIDENNPVSMGVNYTVNDMWISIEKSSFSALGKIRLQYSPEFAQFSDTVSQMKKENKKDYVPPEEKTIGMFDDNTN